MPKIKNFFFTNACLTDTRFLFWLSKSTDSTKANFKLCKKDFFLSHASGSNHLKNMKHKEEIQNSFSKATAQKISQSEPENHPFTDSTEPGNRTPSSSKSGCSSTIPVAIIYLLKVNNRNTRARCENVQS